MFRLSLATTPPLATVVPRNDFTRANAKIQAASLDLTIGQIFIPGTEAGKAGAADSPLDDFMLREGHTAVIKTAEVLKLSPDIVGIGFPPAHLSAKGLLTTNPGLIDPGYEGPLHLTVINMSNQPFALQTGTRIMRVIFLTLDSQPTASYDARHPGPASTLITPSLLRQLSVDFLDVEDRAKRIAKAQVKKGLAIAAALPALVTIIAVIGTIYATESSVKTDLQNLKEKISVVDTQQKLEQALVDRIQKVENDVARLNPPVPNIRKTTR